MTAVMSSVMERGNEWSVRVAAGIGRRVAHYRAQADLTAAMLSERCAGLGLPLDRNVIAKLETGHRRSVTVDEVYVLAAALEIPPALLLFGVGREESAEILPDYHAPAFRALQWFTGESTFPRPDRADVVTTWQPSSGPAAPLAAYRGNDDAGRKELGVLADAATWRDRAASAATEREQNACEAAAEVQLQAAAEARGAGERIREWAAGEGYLPPRPIGMHEVVTGDRTGTKPGTAAG